jgi:hypothetical protein
MGRAMRRAVILVAATLASLVLPAAAAADGKRCCFRAVVTGSGVMESTWGQVSEDQIGGDLASWTWSERHILSYRETGNFSELRPVYIGSRMVKPSTIYWGAAQSTVQWGAPGSYSPGAAPGACGAVSVKLREGVTPELLRRSSADQGARDRFRNTVMFLSAGSSGAAHSGMGHECLYGHHPNNIEGWERQACPGQHHFSLPAPRRAWFRRGEDRIHKTVRCRGGHEPSAADYINHKFEADGSFSVTLSWFPPSRLRAEAERLRDVHRQTTPGGE